MTLKWDCVLNAISHALNTATKLHTTLAVEYCLKFKAFICSYKAYNITDS